MPSGPATTYQYFGPLSYPVSSFTKGSKFVLYESGAYSLHYAAFTNAYVSRYTQEGARISFLSSTGLVDPIGTLNGDLLEIRYSEQSHQADFEDAVYKRAP